jgi:hypothetical protein
LNRFNIRQQRWLVLNMETGHLLTMTLSDATRKMVRVEDISQIEKSAQEPSRAVFMFFGELQRPLDLTFTDSDKRDSLVAALVALNPNIHVKAS